MAVIVDQKRLGGGSHSTVGTITDIYTVLRLLFSRVGKPHVGYSNAFSFNDPAGHVPRVQRPRHESSASLPDDFLDMSKSLNEGAVQVPFFASVGSERLRRLGLLRQRQEARRLHARRRWTCCSTARTASSRRVRRQAINSPTRHHREDRAHVHPPRHQDAARSARRRRSSRTCGCGPCPLCKGARLSQAALAAKINGHNIAELRRDGDRRADPGRADDRRAPSPRRSSPTLVERLQAHGRHRPRLSEPRTARPTRSRAASRSASRWSSTSAAAWSTCCTSSTSRASASTRATSTASNELLRKLRDKGNTVLVVEHDPDVIQVADHVDRHGARRGQRRRRDRLRGHVRRPAPGRHADRPAPAPIAADQGRRRASRRGRLPIQQRPRQQPAGRRASTSRPAC